MIFKELLCSHVLAIDTIVGPRTVFLILNCEMNWAQVRENDGHYGTTLSTQRTLLTASGAVRKMLQKAGSDAIVRVAYIKQTLQTLSIYKNTN